MSTLAAGPFENGAAVLKRMDVRTVKFDVFRCDAVLISSKRDLAAAVALAQSLPGPDELGLDPIKPPPTLSWSKRAAGRVAELGANSYAAVEEPRDGEPAKTMSPARQRSGLGASDRPTPQALRRPREAR